MKVSWRTGVVLACLGCWGAPVEAYVVRSVYSTLELKHCRVIKKHPDGNSWVCPGLEGYPVYFAEGDLRAFVSVGDKPDARRAATQTLGPFNSIFPPKSRRVTIEWRVAPKSPRPAPYATILRYYTEQDGAKGQVLVVSRVTEKETCHVAYVDALATPDAIKLARSFADERARNANCDHPPVVFGSKGRSPM